MEVMAVKTTLTFKIGSPRRMQMAAHSHTAFEGTLCFGWIFRQMDEKGIPSSLDKAYT
jgi:acyl-CoA hydrolase